MHLVVNFSTLYYRLSPYPIAYPESSPIVSPRPAAPQVAAKLGMGNTIPPLANKLRRNTPEYPKAFHQ